MIFAFVVVTVVGLCVALVVAVARDPGASPVEIALGYEHAKARRDFDVVYRLSAAELYGGMRKADYVAAQRAAHAGEPTPAAVEDAVAEAEHRVGDEATVVTRVSRADGRVEHHEVRLLRRSRVWEVVAYRLRPAPTG